MEENKNYTSYRYGDLLTPGKELKIDHSISVKHADISLLIAMGKSAVEAMRLNSIDGEQRAFDIVVAAANQWEQQAALTQTYERALEYLNTREVKHTGNQWKKEEGYRDGEGISNRVYKMSCRVWEDTKYDRKTDQHVTVAWYVSWDVYLNSPKGEYMKQIAGQLNKRYTDKAAAMKYLEGRKKVYSHLFTEISPPISKEYENFFMVSGVLLPGYTVEGEEPRQKKQTVGELSSEKSAAVTKEGRNSVLEKLSAANDTSVESPKISGRKKEDISR